LPDEGRKIAMKKYFIAVVLPEPVYSRVELLKQDLKQQHGLKGALRSPAHITLHRPFVWKEEKEHLLIDALTRFEGGRAFEVDLRGFDFFEPRVVFVNVLPNAALEQLYQKLKVFARRDLKLLNEWEDLRGFHPHVTIANRDLKKPKFYQLQEEYREKPFEARFVCNGISLLRLEKTWEILQNFAF